MRRETLKNAAMITPKTRYLVHKHANKWSDKKHPTAEMVTTVNVSERIPRKVLYTNSYDYDTDLVPKKYSDKKKSQQTLNGYVDKVKKYK